MRGGKRLRPALLFAARDCVEPDAHPEASTDVGAAIELFQTYLLIHDDWMDNDPIRRGAPSVHVALARHYDDEHLGASSAILAGDLLSALVHDLVGTVELPGRAASRARRRVGTHGARGDPRSVPRRDAQP